MPFMYPEELAKLRADHPGIQYDGRGNVIGVTQPDSVQMAANAIYQMPGVQPDAWSFGPTRADFQNSKDFIGPVQPQWWDPNGELFQQGQNLLGGFMAGRDIQPRRIAQSRNPFAPARRAPSYDYSKYGTTFPLQYDDGSGEGPERPYSDYSKYEAYGAPYPLQYDDGSGEGPARPAPPYQKYEAYGLRYPFSHDDGSGEFVPQ